jgi:hypothetical protein
MSSISYISSKLRIKQARRELDKLLMGLAPLQGSKPPLVNMIFEAARYSLSVTPPKWFNVY